MAETDSSRSRSHPQLAHDTDRSVAEARRLWKAVNRPNVMIKIPGTREGWPAVQCCLGEGININITLPFSVEHYQAVADAYVRALGARVERGESIDRVWVQVKDEPEIRTAFEHTLAVRALRSQAKELADRFFFETLVRVHRVAV